MILRELPQAEWPRLAGTEAGTVWAGFDPANTTVLVVEDASGTIIGTWVLLRIVHAECLWIHPDHRAHAGVSRLLLGGGVNQTRQWGAHFFFTSAMSNAVRKIVRRLGGQPLPGEMYSVPIGAPPCQP